MASEPLPDHYKALGVEKGADAITIKKAYRALALKCHPDKITDPVLRAEKQDEFHKIQAAYETLGDEEKKAVYEANLTLEALRREKAARGATTSSREKSTRFDARPSGGATRYATEERRPSATTTAYDEDKYYDSRDRDRSHGSTRSKYDTYAAYPKSGSSPRAEKESSRAAKASTERSRSDRNKARDKEERRERKFVSVESESSADEKARYEADYKRRSHEEEARRQAEAARRKADEQRDQRRSYDESRYPTSGTTHRLSSKEEEALRHMQKTRTQAGSDRPSPVRTSSRDYYGESRSSRKEARPETVRRSSAVRPSKERTSTSSRRDSERGFPEIVEWGGEETSRRAPPPLKPYNSSPGNIEIPRAMPQRAYTTSESRDHRTSTSPPPSFHRSQTMPSVPHSSSRSKTANVSRPTPLREAMTPEHHSPEPDFPSVPSAQPTSGTSKKYYYPTPGGGVEVPSTSHRTVMREPERHRHRSPSPLTRPPIGPNRPSEANISKTAVPPPSMGRSSSSRNVSPVREERGRSRPLYGEVGASYTSRPRPTRQNSFSPNNVSYAPRYGVEDVRFAPKSRENDRAGEYVSKPTLGRTATYVY
ncbi:DnaJ-domain-containing protein [Setomelanomma holmii]|uniref:DnaJ-domain-containing protein n=1 Tax=Setomelanomma holmii TaxID=210430 RepID=A0A9P4LGD7_9PLEO|nr:DnaJ-domain-containing protein [Setomelanomma holmii]